MTFTNRILIALGIAAAIYAVALGIGGVLYATDNIPLGATHNDCEGIRKAIAEERGIKEHDVEQSELKERTRVCLEEHRFDDQSEPFRKEYLVWGAWPGIVCGIIFLSWPSWARILHNQEVAEGAHGQAGG